MAQRMTVDDLRRALVHLAGAVKQLREIAGDFPAIDKELHAAADILGTNDGDPKPGAR